MKSKLYFCQMEIFIIWIVAVTLLFKFVPSKQIAGAIAGFGFVLWPTLFFIFELRQSLKDKIYMTILAIFLLANALPIFLLRILNWGTDFSELSLLGIPAARFHGVSNVMYLIMMSMSAWLYFKNKKIEKGHI